MAALSKEEVQRQQQMKQQRIMPVNAVASIPRVEVPQRSGQTATPTAPSAFYPQSQVIQSGVYQPPPYQQPKSGADCCPPQPPPFLICPPNFYPPLPPRCCDDYCDEEEESEGCLASIFNCLSFPFVRLRCLTLLTVLLLLGLVALLAVLCGWLHVGTELGLLTPWSVVKGSAKFDVKPNPSSPFCCRDESSAESCECQDWSQKEDAVKKRS